VAFQKKWAAIASQPLEANSTAFGVVTVADTEGFFVGQAVWLSNNVAANNNSFQVKRVLSSTQMILGPIDNNLVPSDFSNLSVYTTASVSIIGAGEQDKLVLTNADQDEGTYEREPVNARRSILVDVYGNPYGPTNPLPANFTGTVTIGTIAQGAPNATLSQAWIVKLTNGTYIANITPAGAVSVDGSAVTQPISATALPLPALAATSTKQSDGTQKTQIVDNTGGNAIGSQAIGGSNYLQVALPSGAVGVSSIVPDSNVINNGTIAAAAVPLLINSNGLSSVSIEITGTWVGSIVVQGSDDSLNFVTLLTASGAAGLFSNTPITANGRYRVFRTSATKVIQVIATAWTSGTATIAIQGSTGISAVEIVQQNAANNLSQAWTFDGTGNAIGSVGGALKVTSVALGNTPSQFVRNDYTVTAVTTAAFTQLIASTTQATSVLEIFDSSGQTLELAFGASGFEVPQFLIFPGGNGRVTCNIPAATRVSIKAVSANASVGEIDLNLYV
jgi:hypothetical protein